MPIAKGSMPGRPLVSLSCYVSHLDWKRTMKTDNNLESKVWALNFRQAEDPECKLCIQGLGLGFLGRQNYLLRFTSSLLLTRAALRINQSNTNVSTSNKTKIIYIYI